jgi:hypothetical protein
MVSACCACAATADINADAKAKWKKTINTISRRAIPQLSAHPFRDAN